MEQIKHTWEGDYFILQAGAGGAFVWNWEDDAQVLFPELDVVWCCLCDGKFPDWHLFKFLLEMCSPQG